MVNFYIEALKVWNAGGEAWCIPRKGTEKQKEVKAIMEKAKYPNRRKLRKASEEEPPPLESVDAPIRPENKNKKVKEEKPKEEKKVETSKVKTNKTEKGKETGNKMENLDGTYVLQDKSTGNIYSGRGAGKTDYNLYKLAKKNDDVYDFKLVYVSKKIANDPTNRQYVGVPKRKINIDDVKVLKINDTSFETSFATDKGTFTIPKGNKDELRFYEKAIKELK